MTRNILPAISVTAVLISMLVFLSGSTERKAASNTLAAAEDTSWQTGPHPLRFPQVSIRTEKYLLPAISTGPLDPEWSPDGRWITFSMRGDIWKMPSEGVRLWL